MLMVWNVKSIKTRGVYGNNDLQVLEANHNHDEGQYEVDDGESINTFNEDQNSSNLLTSYPISGFKMTLNVIVTIKLYPEY